LTIKLSLYMRSYGFALNDKRRAIITIIALAILSKTSACNCCIKTINSYIDNRNISLLDHNLIKSHHTKLDIAFLWMVNLWLP